MHSYNLNAATGPPRFSRRGVGLAIPHSGPSTPALVLDLVFLIALPTALDTDGPAWLRVVGGVIALIAAVLGVCSAAALRYANR